MVDRAAILDRVLRRNAVRRNAWLPPLDVDAEFQRDVAVAIEAEVRAMAERPEHRAMLERIRAEVADELALRSGRGRDACRSWGGRYWVGYETTRRFWSAMRTVYDAEAEPIGP